ncbi:las seventeen-binding protein [Colletotrichum truncatum]|uniref:Las seventeen-binding protein n=1 Tax=Colletotrichum truncatum TaxID=5467 RepID=A0ACC3ZJG2_COLTU|nr:las seventeen-binding protein [Colletotrichum truncatum]KAF6799624.1 las seventeen-binding protein [Colletotrichum truncatum]
MQRVSSFLPSWEARRRSNASSTSNGRSSIIAANSRSPLDKVFRWSSKPAPLATTSLATAASRVGREAYWPATLDAECDRSARILKSFCSDGFLAPMHDQLDRSSTTTEPQTPIRIFKKIPPRIIQNAAGIAIFTCMRSGLWMTGSGGSGILIARKADGTWSPPSGIVLHTPSLSFVMGVDIYDCVLVINNIAALEQLITKPTITLGEDIGLTVGPLVALESTEVDSKWRDLDNTVLTYMKARGQSQNVNLTGCILKERANENERFYGGNVTVMDILAGNVSRHVEETRPMFEVIKEAEGRIDADQSILKKLSAQPAPGDAMIETPRSLPASPKTSIAFGVPNADDPDPFGVLALEMAGLEIREAGTRLRPTSHQFEFNPTPSSPAFSKFSRQSVETIASRSNRGSLMSTKTNHTKLSEAFTHTNTAITTPHTSPSQSQSQSEDGASIHSLPVLKEPEEVDYTKIDFSPLRQISGSHSIEGTVMSDSDDHLRTDVSTMDDTATKASSIYTKDDASIITKQDDEKEEVVQTEEQDGDADEEDEDEEEEAVIYEVAAVQPARTAVMAAPIHAKGALVTIPKRIPPPLPARSPARASRASKSEIGDVSHLHSPLQSSFTPSPRQSIDSVSIKSESSKISSVKETPTGVVSDDEKLKRTDSVATEKLLVDESTVKIPEIQEPEQATPLAPGAFPDESTEFIPTLGSPLQEVSSIDSRNVAPKAVNVV